MIEGQENSKRTSFAGLAFDLNPATVIFYDTLADRQPQAQPFSLSRAKERQKNPRQILIVYAKTGVSDGYNDHRTGSVGTLVLGFYVQAAADRHGIDGIQVKIDQYLLQLLHIGVDVRQV